jgi:hypothetical protein
VSLHLKGADRVEQDESAACTGESPEALLALFVADVESADAVRLGTVLRSLADARRGGLRVCAVLGLATSPTLLLPQLPAEAVGCMEPYHLKLATPQQAMDTAMRRLQVRAAVLCPSRSRRDDRVMVDIAVLQREHECRQLTIHMMGMQAGLQVPDVILSGRVHMHLQDMFLDLDYSASLLATHLRLAALHHARRHPIAPLLVPHVVKGDKAALRAALAALPAPAVESLAVGGAGGGAAALQTAPTKRKSGKAGCAPSAAAIAEAARWLLILRASILESQLALEWLHMAAQRTGVAFSWRVWTAAAASFTSLALLPKAQVDLRAGAIGLKDDELARMLRATALALQKLSASEVQALASELLERAPACADKQLLPRQQASLHSIVDGTFCEQAAAPAHAEQDAPPPAHDSPPDCAARKAPQKKSHRQTQGAFLAAQAAAASGASEKQVWQKHVCGGPPRRPAVLLQHRACGAQCHQTDDAVAPSKSELLETRQLFIAKILACVLAGGQSLRARAAAPERTPAGALADAVCGALWEMLDSPPIRLPCAELLYFDDVACFSDCIRPAPRQRMHQTLMLQAAELVATGLEAPGLPLHYGSPAFGTYTVRFSALAAERMR